MADAPVSLTIVVNRARQGDTRAFDCLVRQFQDRAVAYARTLLRDPSAAEDAAQEAFVQAWRDLPRLAQPEAFGGWLRRIVFKFCDRIRRRTQAYLPLTEGVISPSDQEPSALLEKAEMVAQVHSALERLPMPQREAALLYYMTGQDVKEIAAFLEVSPSTVKNRLFAARKRLRKELWMMAETVLAAEKPSQNDEFVGKVLARVLREFQDQEAADPHTANRGLLKEGKVALSSFLASQQTLDWETLRTGFLILERQSDHHGMASLLMRALAQDWNDSQTAWIYLHLANRIAAGGSAAGAVLAHEAFERWLPGKSPRLLTSWPNDPADDTATADAYTTTEVRLLFLGQSGEFATSYVGVWRHEEYLRKVDSALSETAPTPVNRGVRFIVFRMACTVCEAVADFDRAAGFVARMYALAEEAVEEKDIAYWKTKAIGHDMHLRHKRGDEEGFLLKAGEMADLLASLATKEFGQESWIKGERHDLAHQFTMSKRYEEALPLWEANAATGGQVNGWGWLLYAATVWQMTKDRERTLTLLRETCVRDDRDMVPIFRNRPEFADVENDLEFLRAIRRE